MKLYEEKREITEQKSNRFSRLGFEEFQNIIGDKKKACHKLFELIKKDPELVAAKMFNEHDLLSEKMSDKFVFDNFVVPFEKYFFYTTKVDGLGSAYEVLGERSGKDTKAGQFFTPENIVRFMVMLADLKSDDVVLDFACGTARFLIYAMEDMIVKVSGGNTTTKKKHITEDQLYGTDYDPYVAKLSKMNMYIHGDGKTNIQDKDGLLLYEMDGQIDAILTNPPLGNLDYRLEAYDENFLLKRMSVIPKKNITQDKIDKLEFKLESEAVGTKQRNIENKIKQLRIQLETNPLINVTGKEMKGGALFTNSAWHYLKDISNTDMPIEWRGGKLVVVVDEGTLNTDEYSKFREFIKTHYYIKAVISLTSDTFVPVSKTLTKTSILFLIKKTDSDAVQREPVFYAYVDKVGLNTKRKVCDNHLFADDNIATVLGHYNEFRKTVLGCYIGTSLNSAKLTSSLKIGKSITVKGQSYYYIRQFSEIGNRIDENYNNPKYDEIDEIIKKADTTMPLGDKKIIKNITSGKTPKGITYLTDDTAEGIPFLGAHQITYSGVNLNTAPKITEEYHTGVLKSSTIKKGLLLITMAGAVGRCSLYEYDEEANANQAVAIIELQKNKDILPEYLKYYLNSKIGQLYFQKYQHVSSQPNINLEEIKRINVIILNSSHKKK